MSQTAPARVPRWKPRHGDLLGPWQEEPQPEAGAVIPECPPGGAESWWGASELSLHPPVFPQRPRPKRPEGRGQGQGEQRAWGAAPCSRWRPFLHAPSHLGAPRLLLLKRLQSPAVNLGPHVTRFGLKREAEVAGPAWASRGLDCLHFVPLRHHETRVRGWPLDPGAMTADRRSRLLQSSPAWSRAPLSPDAWAKQPLHR